MLFPSLPSTDSATRRDSLRVSPALTTRPWKSWLPEPWTRINRCVDYPVWYLAYNKSKGWRNKEFTFISWLQIMIVPKWALKPCPMAQESSYMRPGTSFWWKLLGEQSDPPSQRANEHSPACRISNFPGMGLKFQNLKQEQQWLLHQGNAKKGESNTPTYSWMHTHSAQMALPLSTVDF